MDFLGLFPFSFNGLDTGLPIAFRRTGALGLGRFIEPWGVASIRIGFRQPRTPVRGFFLPFLLPETTGCVRSRCPLQEIVFR